MSANKACVFCPYVSQHGNLSRHMRAVHDITSCMFAILQCREKNGRLPHAEAVRAALSQKARYTIHARSPIFIDDYHKVEQLLVPGKIYQPNDDVLTRFQDWLLKSDKGLISPAGNRASFLYIKRWLSRGLTPQGVISSESLDEMCNGSQRSSTKLIYLNHFRKFNEFVIAKRLCSSEEFLSFQVQISQKAKILRRQEALERAQNTSTIDVSRWKMFCDELLASDDRVHALLTNGENRDALCIIFLRVYVQASIPLASFMRLKWGDLSIDFPDDEGLIHIEITRQIPSARMGKKHITVWPAERALLLAYRSRFCMQQSNHLFPWKTATVVSQHLKTTAAKYFDFRFSSIVEFRYFLTTMCSLEDLPLVITGLLQSDQIARRHYVRRQRDERQLEGQ